MRCEEVWELLSAYIDGEAASEEAEMVERHLSVCGDCTHAARLLRATSDVLAILDEIEPPYLLRSSILNATINRQTWRHRLSSLFSIGLTTTGMRYGIVAGAAAGSLLATVGANAQTEIPAFAEGESPFGITSQKATGAGKGITLTNRGKSCSETIRGNGTRAGYSLSHAGILPGSVSVMVGIRTLHENEDYFLDPASGMIGFNDPVRRTETISVSYRYVEGQDASRSPIGGLSGLGFNFNGAALNFGMGMSTNSSGLDFQTYGLALNTATSTRSKLNGLFYFSNPAANKDNLVGDTRAAMAASAQKARSADAVSDHLISQNYTLTSGASSFHATYQDVGAHFNGFQAMKLSNAKNADMMTQLTALEKEKGVRRLGFGAGFQTGKASNLGFDWTSINDGTDKISKESIGYQSKLFNLKYSAQRVGSAFSNFKGLREADAAQWTHEAGLKRSDLTLGMAAGKNGLFSFNDGSIGDKTGKLQQEGLSFANKTFKFAMFSRKADAAFTRIGDLTDAEKANLALEIRRQFNPNADAKEVTAPDKAALTSEAGLNRNRVSLAGVLGKSGTFGFNQFSIADTNGRIQRQSFSLALKRATFNYLDQNISDTFSHLPTMGPFEKLQFANEVGIHRRSLDFNFTPSKGSTLVLSQLSLSDKLGGMTRDSLAYTAKGMDFKLNLAGADKTFNRIADLAGFTPADKALMEAERGFRKLDYTANYTAIKGLTLSSYDYSAHDSLDSIDKSAYKHSFAWNNGKLSQITFLLDGNRTDLMGKTQDGIVHEQVAVNELFAKGIKLNLLHDSLAKVTAGLTVPTAVTNFFHLESDKAKANNFVTEMKRLDLGNGKFENTSMFDMNYRANKTLTFHFNKLGIDRGFDPSADTNLLDWKWQAAKTTSVTGTYATTKTNNNTDAVVKAFAVSGLATKNINLTGTYSEVNQIHTNVKSIVDISASNAKPAKAFGLKNVTLTAKYASTHDQSKQQSQNVGAKLAAMAGKNQIGMEYSSVLNPNGTNGIVRSLTYISDPNPKLPFHMDLLYKARTLNRDSVSLVRKYNASLKLNPANTVSYTYISLPEDQALVMQQQKSSTFALKHAVTKTINLGVDYVTSKQLAAMTETSKLGGLMNGKLDKQTGVEVGYSVDLATNAGARTDARTVKLGFDHQVDGDHFITVSTSIRDAKGSQEELLANIDFKTRF